MNSLRCFALRWALCLAMLGLANCSKAPEPAQSTSPVAASVAASDLPRQGIRAWQAEFAAGRWTSERLTQAYLDRITAIDDAGPGLNAVITLNPNALQEARAADQAMARRERLGPLHGIPVLIKDNIDVTPMVNSAGSLALATHRPKQDAFIVQKLRAGGAVILGKTNLSEWANFRSTHSVSGCSSLGGQTKNPYALRRNPCGSSSGTGAAIAANLAVVGLGTETDGSIICPSAVNGLVGFKPTVGLLSRSGIIPISATQDTAGPMARSVDDAALMLAVLAAADANDPASATLGAETFAASNALTAARAASLPGKRIGVLRQAMGYHPELDALFEQRLQSLRDAGATLIEVEIASYNQWNEAEYAVLLYEFKDGLERYLQQSEAPIASLQALIDWNLANAESTMPDFGQEILLEAQAKGPLSDQAYLEAKQKAQQLARTEGIEQTLRAHHLDALIAPATGPAWLTDPILGDHFVGAGYGMAAVAGTPSVTLPIGQIEALPVGMVLMAGPEADAALLRLALAIEPLLPVMPAPAFAE